MVFGSFFNVGSQNVSFPIACCSFFVKIVFLCFFEPKSTQSHQKPCVFEGWISEKHDSASNFEGQNHQVSILQYKTTKKWHRTGASGATGATGAIGSWPWTAVRNLPSSRAGVRMTVVLNKLPQINSAVEICWKSGVREPFQRRVITQVAKAQMMWIVVLVFLSYIMSNHSSTGSPAVSTWE